MFNEISNGNTTTEPPPMSPASDMVETRACTSCGTQFAVKSNAPNASCALCFVKQMEDAQRANQPFEAQIWKRKQRQQMFAALGMLVLIVVAVMAFLIRSERRTERMNKYDQWRHEQGYKSTGY